MSFKIFFLLLIAITGALYDWKSRRVPNWLTFGGLGVILVLNTLDSGTIGLINSFLGLFTGLALLLIPYITGGMGAGDVKLLGTIGAITGYKGIITIFLYTAISGLIIGIIWLIFNPVRLKFLIITGQALPTIDKKEKIPYAIPILLGTILYIMFGTGNFFNVTLWQ